MRLAREKMPKEYEKEVARFNNLTQLRKIAYRLLKLSEVDYLK